MTIPVTDMSAPPAEPQQQAADDPAAAFTLIGVRAERLRAGHTGEFLFLVPGLDGESSELTSLAAAFVGPQTVYGLMPVPEAAPSADDSTAPTVATLERMVELMLPAIRRVQPTGPYHLGGYSFGALLALEMAQQLRNAGDTVDSLVLVEAIYDERYWPRGIWLRALVVRTSRHLLRLVRMRPKAAFAEVRVRGGRLVKRFLRRKADAPDLLRDQATDAATMGGRALSAISGYRPRPYAGSITLVASSMDRHFGCDTVRLWDGLAARLDIQRVDGDHVSVINDPASAKMVADIIDHRLALARSNWEGIRPTPGFENPMILTTMKWFSAARLAHALTEAGYRVSACRPRGHALDVVEGLTGDFRLNRLWRKRSVAKAIRSAKPDIVLPDDERALNVLRKLYVSIKTSDPGMAALLAHSLGNVTEWNTITSRTALAKRAQGLGVTAPDTDVVRSWNDLRSWVTEHGLPVVLKTDGSFGGRGVAAVHTDDDLRRAWRRVSRPVPLPRALKRLVFDLESGPLAAWIRRSRPVVNVQQFATGREAIATVACVNGKVEAMVCLEVVHASQPQGPAAVIGIIDHPGMVEAARALVAQCGLTGFCGFDFIITATSEAYLLELNPRVTPTAYLLAAGDFTRPRTIALFPRDVIRGSGRGASVAGDLDTPSRAPALVRRGEHMAATQHHLPARAARRLKRALSPSGR